MKVMKNWFFFIDRNNYLNWIKKIIVLVYNIKNKVYVLWVC